MIDINELRQSLGAVQPEEVAELLDRLEAAESVLKDFGTTAQEVECWLERYRCIEREAEARRARIEAMERQEPVGQFIQHPSNGLWEQDGYGDNPDARPLYTLPGAKGEKK